MVFKLESNRLAVCFMFNNRSSRNTGGAPRGLSSVLAHVGSFLISTHRRFFPLFVYSVLLLIFGFSMDRCLSGLKASPPRRARDLSFSNDANVGSSSEDSSSSQGQVRISTIASRALPSHNLSVICAESLVGRAKNTDASFIGTVLHYPRPYYKTP